MAEELLDRETLSKEDLDRIMGEKSKESSDDQEDIPPEVTADAQPEKSTDD